MTTNTNTDTNPIINAAPQLKVGVVFPQTEIGNDPSHLRAYAQAVESIGYAHILAYDHVLGASTANRPGWTGPYTHETPFHEIFTLFSYFAGVTARVGFITGVVILPQRQTALVAKQAAQVDLLCGGRLRLGIGIGWNAVEYEGLNEDFKTRGARSEEQIALLRALWTEPIVTFKGRWDTITEAGINPLPVQRPIPIWIGGDAPPVLARVGRLADGWLPQTPPDEATAAQIRQIRAAAVEAGRDPASIGIEPRLTIKRTPQALWPEFIRGWQALGATHLSINTMGLGFTSVDQHIQALRDGWDAIHGILGYAAPQG